MSVGLGANISLQASSEMRPVYGVIAANPMPYCRSLLRVSRCGSWCILGRMDTALLDAVEINPVQPARASIIWLHGLGADGHDFEPLIPQLDIVDRLGVRVVLPHAPRRPVTINAGMVMPAWYDVAAADFSRGQDSEGIRASEAQLRALIAREFTLGIPAARILLAGFSQGGAIVLHTGLRYPEPLAGILALSTYLPLAARLEAEMSPANRAIPIMMAHGTRDPVVPLHLAEQSRDRLQQAGYHVDWHTYAMPHAVYPEEVADIRRWLAQRLGPAAAPA
jgi:phospholipase/carboxylesterase